MRFILTTLVLWAALSPVAPVAATGYIELTKDGYRITDALKLEEGLDIEGGTYMFGLGHLCNDPPDGVCSRCLSVCNKTPS